MTRCGLYGAGRFGYSINEATSTAVHLTGSGATSLASAGTASFETLTANDSASVNFDDEWIAANTIGDVDAITILS